MNAHSGCKKGRLVKVVLEATSEGHRLLVDLDKILLHLRPADLPIPVNCYDVFLLSLFFTR